MLRVVISAFGVMLAASIIPGIEVAGFWTAIVVATAFGILNATLGLVLKILTFPLTLVTLGLFLLVINVLMFWATSFVKGFSVSGFWAAFFGALIVTAVSIQGKSVVKRNPQGPDQQY